MRRQEGGAERRGADLVALAAATRTSRWARARKEGVALIGLVSEVCDTQEVAYVVYFDVGKTDEA